MKLNGYQIVNESLNQLSDISTPEQLLKWMSKNILYGWVGKDGKRHEGEVDGKLFYKEYFLQSPEQLFKSKLGVCWDQVEFERTFFKRFKYKIHTVYYYNPNDNSHTFLAFEKPDGLYWFENSFFKKRGVHGPFKTLKEIVNECSSPKKIAYWSEYKQPKYGISCDEFMNFVKRK